MFNKTIERIKKYKVIFFKSYCLHKIQQCINNHTKRRKLKVQLKAELLPIAWHPDRIIDWCFDKDKKDMLEKLWS